MLCKFVFPHLATEFPIYSTLKYYICIQWQVPVLLKPKPVIVHGNLSLYPLILMYLPWAWCQSLVAGPLNGAMCSAIKDWTVLAGFVGRFSHLPAPTLDGIKPFCKNNLISLRVVLNVPLTRQMSLYSNTFRCSVCQKCR